MTPSEARELLGQLEPRLGQAPHQALGIDRDADIVDACVAFTAAAQRYHPRLFAGQADELVHRAKVAYGRLRQALAEFVERSRGQRVTRYLLRDTSGRLPQH